MRGVICLQFEASHLRHKHLHQYLVKLGAIRCDIERLRRLDECLTLMFENCKLIQGENKLPVFVVQTPTKKHMIPRLSPKVQNAS